MLEQLALERAYPTLEFLLLSAGILQRPSKAHFRISGNHLRSASTCIALFEFCNAAPVQFVDYLKLTNASFQTRVCGEKTLVGLWCFEMTVCGRRRRSWGRLTQLEGMKRTLRVQTMVGEGDTVKHVLRRNVRIMLRRR